MLNKFKKFDSFSFVYDGVIDDDFDGEINSQKEDIRNFITELVKLKKNIYIFTKRYSKAESESNNKKLKKILTESNRKEYLPVKEFIENYGLNHNLVIWTSRSTYYQYLGNMETHCHFDVSNYEIGLIKQHSPYITTININQENWNNDN